MFRRFPKLPISLCALAAVSVLALVCSGCMTGMIVSGGKNYSFLGDENATATDIHKELGPPAWRKSYPRPVKIRDTEEYRKLPRWVSPIRENGTYSGVDAKNFEITTCEVFRTTGMLSGSTDPTPYGMGIGMTFFLGELMDPLLLPGAVKYRMDHADDVVWLTLWFDSGQRLVAWFNRDIRDPGKSTSKSPTREPLEAIFQPEPPNQ